MKKAKISFIVVAFFLVLLVVYLQLSHNLFTRGFNYIRDIKFCHDKYEQADFSNCLKDKLLSYIDTSKKNGVPECRDEAEFIKAVKAGKLEEVPDGEYYVRDKMPYSYPYLTERTVMLLDEIGRDFKTRISETRLKKTRLIITSMTRTTEQLLKLKDINDNVSLISPHLNGNAFDITYVRFKSNRLFLTPCDRDYLRKALSEVIWQLRKEKKCWATYEKSQHCFHVVAR